MRIYSAIACSFVTAGAAMAEAPNVVTDIPPLHSLVAQVMGEVGTPELLMDQAADPHSFQLRPSQARSLATADLVVWIGPELTPWLATSLETLAPDANQLALLTHPQTEQIGFEEEHDHGHDDDHGHGEIDPHAWLDPDNAVVWIDVIATQLSELDPENAATYAANADTARAGVDALSKEIETLLDHAHEAPIVTLHDAYGYFEHRFHIEFAAALRDGDATSPGAARIAELQEMLRTSSITCLLAEPQHNASQLEVLTEGTTARLGLLDPSGTSLEAGPALYSTLMRNLATEIAGCLPKS